MKGEHFNLRVYGLLMNQENQILISDEEQNGFKFTKFPGGGLEFGESLTDALKREFIEEMNLDIEIEKHFYTTDFYVKSAFDGGQLIAVYYVVKPLTEMNFNFGKFPFDFTNQTELNKQCLRFVDINNLKTDDLTFPVDKHVVDLLKTQLISYS